MASAIRPPVRIQVSTILPLAGKWFNVLPRVCGVPFAGEALGFGLVRPNESGHLGGQAHLVVGAYPGKLGYRKRKEQADAKGQ